MAAKTGPGMVICAASASGIDFLVVVRTDLAQVMPLDPEQTTYFRKARFSTRLPNSYRYAPSHYWVDRVEPDLYRVGMTRFATRMLGDFVELMSDVATGSEVERGESLGSIEGFKAVAELYSPVSGIFAGTNPQLQRAPEHVDRNPYTEGWLYQIRGICDDDLMDVSGYIELLETTIERLVSEQAEPKDKKC